MSVDITILLEGPRWIYLSPSKQGKREWDRDVRAKAMEELELPQFGLRFPFTKENHTSLITLEAAGYCSTQERAPG